MPFKHVYMHASKHQGICKNSDLCFTRRMIDWYILSACVESGADVDVCQVDKPKINLQEAECERKES